MQMSSRDVFSRQNPSQKVLFQDPISEQYVSREGYPTVEKEHDEKSDQVQDMFL